MQYREMGKTGDKISILGYGCMRFPRSGRRVDEKRAAQQLISAIERGVNYVDTAYLYMGNEAILGNILSNGYREKVFLATKLPPMQVNSRADMEKILDVQLKRLKTDHIDYYLIHMLMTMGGWERLKMLGVEDFLQKSIDAGKIRRTAFSFHGTRGEFAKILDDYPWDMCQLQYNYADEFNQAGRAGVDYAYSKGIGVSVMEPLRGGRLAAAIPSGVSELFEKADIDRTPAEWALRWVWDHPGVTTLLSGMNEEAHIDENIRIACEAKSSEFSREEQSLFKAVRETLDGAIKVPCTGCSYCMPCPYGVNIPTCFTMLNDMSVFESGRQKFWYTIRTSGLDGTGGSYASLCRECGACEKKCPQGIEIRKGLRLAKAELEGGYFKPMSAAIRGYMKVGKMLTREKNRNR